MSRTHLDETFKRAIVRAVRHHNTSPDRPKDAPPWEPAYEELEAQYGCDVMLPRYQEQAIVLAGLRAIALAAYDAKGLPEPT